MKKIREFIWDEEAEINVALGISIVALIVSLIGFYGRLL